MMKKLALWMAALLLVVGVSACGPKPETPADTGAPTATDAPPAEDAAPAPAAE